MTIGIAQTNAQGQYERLLALARQAESGERAEIVQVSIRNKADVTAATETHPAPLHLISDSSVEINSRFQSHFQENRTNHLVAWITGELA